MKLRQAIPYEQMKELILDCPDERTQALIAFQYACGCRVGELVTYEHRKLKPEIKRKIKRFKARKEAETGNIPKVKMKDSFFVNSVTEGIKKKHLSTVKSNKGGYLLKIMMGNFKAPTISEKGMPVSSKSEKWLYNVLVGFAKNKDGPLFRFGQSWARKLVDAELKKYNPDWSTHWLRHARITHWVEKFKQPLTTVQRFAGHTNLASTSVYVHPDSQMAEDRMVDAEL